MKTKTYLRIGNKKINITKALKEYGVKPLSEYTREEKENGLTTTFSDFLGLIQIIQTKGKDNYQLYNAFNCYGGHDFIYNDLLEEVGYEIKN